MRELTGGLGTDIVIETAGTQITTSQAIHIAKKGSTIVLVGYSKTGELTLPVSLALDKELTFKTVSVIVIFIHLQSMRLLPEK